VIKPAFEQLVRENQRIVYQVAYSVLQHAADADDVTQDAFVRAYANAGDLRDPARFRAWICRIARNLALNRLRDDRRRARRAERAAQPDLDPGDTAQAAIDGDFSHRMRTAIAALPEHLRDVVTLCAIDGLEPSIVASMLGIPSGTVRSRLHLARKRLLERFVP
jgi:RNA polymerase sigma-70 factor (ECF subfamily)